MILFIISFLASGGVFVLIDALLLSRVARGDSKALQSLYNQWGGHAMAIARRLLKDEADAEDVVQDTFLQLWGKAREFDPGRGSAKAWILTIARTRALDRLRSRSSAHRKHAAEATVEQPAQTEPLELVEQRQSRDRLLLALGSLSAEQRSALEMAYFEGLTQNEIAAQTGIPLGTVKTRTRLAMAKLAEVLEPAAAKSQA